MLASFSSREFLNTMTDFDDFFILMKKILGADNKALEFVKYLPTSRNDLNNMHRKSPAKSLKNKVISNSPT